MPISLNIFEGLTIKAGYLCVASLILWGLRRFIIRPSIINDYKRRWQALYLFKVVNILLIVGYILVILKWPTWMGPQFILGVHSLLVDDIIGAVLLISYILCFLWQSYRLSHQTGIPTSSFGSYLMQYGYIWLFILNILVFLRIDNNYLPLITGTLSKFNQTIIEVITSVVFLLLQIGVLYVRQLKMVAAGPELQAMVAEVAACFKIRVKNVRIWKLDRINNAFSTGVFMRGIFVTEDLVNSVGPDDLKMILAHECAHFKCHHLEMRVLLLGVLIYLGLTLMEEYPNLNWLISAAFILAAITIYQAIARRQELKADKLAGEMLGGGPKMADALSRVLGLSAVQAKFGRLMGLLVGHPDLETRVKRLRRRGDCNG